MSDRTKNILKLIIIAISAAFAGYFGGNQIYPLVEEGVKTDSTIIVKEVRTVTTNEFTAEAKAKIKAQLLDSLKGLIKPELKVIYKQNKINIDSIYAEAKKQYEKELSENGPRIFTSTVDTNYVAKDSSGRTRDSIHIVSEFRSPIPLALASQHLISLQHYSYDYDRTISKTVNTTRTITKKNLWSNVSPGVLAAYGYGIKNKTWDFFIGAGASIDIQGLIKTLKGE
ncbi:hypothetical protein ACSSWA_01340 [Melioribacter sp. Ez-97]|uniref:hypothetical protein n=1 Tax=unclassified Melioribacter TaxID=2627329 RepID=UPI003EDAC4EE